MLELLQLVNFFNYFGDLSGTSPSCPTRAGRPPPFSEKLAPMKDSNVTGYGASNKRQGRPHFSGGPRLYGEIPPVRLLTPRFSEVSAGTTEPKNCFNSLPAILRPT